MATIPTQGASAAPQDSNYCLKWNNHQENIVKCFANLLTKGHFLDVTLAAEGKFVRAHRVILSCCSPYFDDLLSLHPEQNTIVFLKDVQFDELKALLDFMYKGEISINYDKMASFLRTAESLQIRGLTQSQVPSSNLSTSHATSLALGPVKPAPKRRRDSGESSDVYSSEDRSNRTAHEGLNVQIQVTPPPLKHRTMLTRTGSSSEARRRTGPATSNHQHLSEGSNVGAEGDNIGQSEDWSEEDESVVGKPEELLVPQLGSWNDGNVTGESAVAGPSRILNKPLQQDTFPSDVIPVPSFVLTNILAPAAYTMINCAAAEGLQAKPPEVVELEGSEGDDEDEEDAVSELEHEEAENPANFATDAEGSGFSELDKIQRVGTRCFMYSCNRCGRLYSKRHSVLRHLRYECGVEPQFQCRICLQRFKHKSDQQRHIRKLHGLDPAELEENLH